MLQLFKRTALILLIVSLRAGYLSGVGPFALDMRSLPFPRLLGGNIQVRRFFCVQEMPGVAEAHIIEPLCTGSLGLQWLRHYKLAISRSCDM